MIQRLSLFSCLILFGLIGTASEPLSSSVPTTRVLIRTLLRTSDVKLDKSDVSKGCKSMEAQDLGDYLSFLISNLDPKTEKRDLSQ